MTFLTRPGLVALAGLASLSVSARAADLPSKAPPPPYVTPVLVSGWDGFYAGSTFGYGSTSFRTRATTSRSRDEDGVISGALIGYNFQTGHFVYGAEGGLDVNTIRGTIAGQPGLPASRVDSIYDARIRGRLGYEFGWFMPFVAGGVVFNETSQSTVAPDPKFGENKTTTGYTVGVGVDIKLNLAKTLGFSNYFIGEFLGPLVLRVEYLHDGLPSETYAFDGRVYRTKSESNLIRLAIISRFGDNPPHPYMDPQGDVNWSGAYGGIFGGGGSFTPNTRIVGSNTRTKFDASGAQGGIYTGTNFILYSHYMLGIEGSTAYTDFHGHGAEPTGPASFRNFINTDLRVRAGYAFGRFLPFFAGGLAYGKSEQTDTVTGSQRGDLTNFAAEIGGGLDYRISERVSLRGEYIHEIGLNRKLVNLNDCFCRQRVDGDTFRIGAAYHFE